jgi:hypothetical protein
MEYERTEEQKQKCWDELMYAVEELFDKDHPNYSSGIIVRFLKGDCENKGKEISIFSHSRKFRNRYCTNPDDLKDYSCWEIFLHKNGTWTIK